MWKGKTAHWPHMKVMAYLQQPFGVKHAVARSGWTKAAGAREPAPTRHAAKEINMRVKKCDWMIMRRRWRPAMFLIRACLESVR